MMTCERLLEVISWYEGCFGVRKGMPIAGSGLALADDGDEDIILHPISYGCDCNNTKQSICCQSGQLGNLQISITDSVIWRFMKTKQVHLLHASKVQSISL